jgi:Cu-Zn family superoxide dismutase
METTTEQLSLASGTTSVFDADGSALVVHANRDDFRTDPTGNAGARIACGVLEKAPAR